MMIEKLELISAISQAIMAFLNVVLIFLIYRQLKSMEKQSELIRTQIREDHKFNRRNTTINLLSSWLRNFDKNSIIARQLLSKLQEDDIRKVFFMEPLEIQKSNYNDNYEKIEALIKALSLEVKEEIINGNKTIKLDNGETAKIRFLMMDYLNTLEIVLAGQNLGIADELLKKEFEYLVDENGCILKKILKIFDPQKVGFPIIRQFCRNLENEKEKESVPIKEPTGQV